MKCTAEKIKKLQLWLKQNRFDGCAVTDLDGVNFFSDFCFAGQGDAYLLITVKKAYCFTKQMYAADIKKKTPYLALIDSLDFKDIVKKAQSLKLKNCIFDTTATAYIPGTLFYKNGFKENSGFIGLLKQIKTGTELSRIKKACAISFKAYDIFRKKLKAGMTELEAASLLESIMQSLGGEGLAFNTIMAFGENSANPHHVNSARKLKQNEAVLIDYGCRYNGYCSDITRTFWFGKKPSEDFNKAYSLVKAAHDLGIKLAKNGAPACLPHNAVSDFFEDNGKLKKHFIHGLGHSLGTAIHEPPFVNGRTKEVLKAGNIITIEPGLYYEGKLGIRYEDTVLITEDKTKILTK